MRAFILSDIGNLKEYMHLYCDQVKLSWKVKMVTGKTRLEITAIN